MGGVVKAVTSPFASVLGFGEKPPSLPKPVVAPTPDDEAIRRARRRAIETASARSGRASTVLSDYTSSGEKLGK